MRRDKPRRRDRITCENRYRHKLNMLWPGQILLRITGALLLAGVLCELMNRHMPAMAAFALAGAVLAVLLILVAVELHQDRVLNEMAMREEQERARDAYREF